MNAGWITDFLTSVLGTVLDVLPIAVILFVFQVAVLRGRIPRLKRVLIGFGYVILGLALFLMGLEKALFPLGKLMAAQLTDPAFAGTLQGAAVVWQDYGWVYLFGAAIGFATTVAEPALIAVSVKANQVSGGSLSAWGLRLAVAVGVAISIALGAFRIVTGTPLYLYMIVGYLVVIAQTMVAPKAIIPLAYDSGGVTTSTVTVPLVTALGIGLASNIPGRSPLIDGFGLIALASLFPMITVMAYAQLTQWASRRRQAKRIGQARRLEQRNETSTSSNGGKDTP